MVINSKAVVVNYQLLDVNYKLFLVVIYQPMLVNANL